MRLDQAARAYIGTPWQHHGRSRHGLDCVGLLFLASRDIGKPFEDFLGYGPMPSPQELVHHGLRQVRRLSRRDLRPGCIVTLGRGHMTHVGIVGDAIAPFSLIHVPTHGTCCETSLPTVKIRGVYGYNCD